MRTVRATGSSYSFDSPPERAKTRKETHFLPSRSKVRTSRASIELVVAPVSIRASKGTVKSGR